MQGPCPNFDLFRHVLVTGGTGCGKTVSVVIPLLGHALATDAAEGNRKPALFVVDVKGDLTVPLRRLAAAHGRTDDLIEITVDSTASANLLANIAYDPFTGSQLLTSAVYQRMGFADIGRENGFWQVGAVGYVASALAWLQFLRQPCTAANLSMLLTGDTKTDWTFADGLKFPVAHIELTANRLRQSPDLALSQLAIILDRLRELRSTDARTRANFLSVLIQLIEALAHPLVRNVTSPDPTWSPESWLREGRILLVRLPFATEPGPSNFIVRLLKLSLYRTILSRFSPSLCDVIRPVFLFMDEAHRFITVDTDTGDQYFVDRCRAMRTGCVFATQSIAALAGVLRDSHLDSFLANTNTRVFGRSLDRTTAETAAAILGDADLIRDYQGTRAEYSHDPDPDIPPQPTFSPAGNGDGQISAADLAQLGVGSFFVASGADLYRWDATIDPADQSPLIQGATRMPPIPSWQDLDEIKELREKVRPSLPPPEIPAPATEVDMTAASPVATAESTPAQTTVPAVAPSPEPPKFTRPVWLKPQPEPPGNVAPTPTPPAKEPPKDEKAG